MGRKLAPKAVPYTKADGTTSYRVRLRVHGKQSSETFDTAAAANVFISRVLDPNIGPERAVEMRDREDSRSSDYVPTVREMLSKHVEELTGVEENTRTEYLAIAERTWLKMLGDFRVDELTRGDVARWVNSIAGTVKPKTIANAHSVLSAVMNTAMQDPRGIVTSNPAYRTRLPRAGEEDEEEIRFLTHEEFDILHREIPADYHPLTVWLFGTGQRWSEATAQQKGDLNLRAGKYLDADTWVSEPTTRVVRAWKKNPRRLGPPKSAAGRRTLVVPGEAIELVEPLLVGTGKSDFIFRTPGRGVPVTHANFYNRIWKPATLRAAVCEDHREKGCRCFSAKPYLCLIHTAKGPRGQHVLPEPCGCDGTLGFLPRIHDARHTHASWIIAAGADLEAVRERLGHEDILTTQRIYRHLMPDARAHASRAASMAFASTSLRLGSGPLAISPPDPGASSPQA